MHPDGGCSINFISENLHSRISKSSTAIDGLFFLYMFVYVYHKYNYCCNRGERIVREV